MKIQRTVLAAARSGRRTAVLLRAVHPVRKLVVRHDVIELRRWLVVPRAPRLAAVARHNRALVAAENHPPRLIGIDPQLMIIVASRSAPEGLKSSPTITRLVDCRIWQINDVRILGINADLTEVPPALPDSPVI